MSDFAEDILHAIRRWAGRPLFALAVTLTLALGIGSTAAVYAVVEAVLLRPLPYQNADRLVTVSVARPEWRSDPVLSAAWNTGTLSWPIVQRLQQATGTLEAFGASSSPRVVIEGERAEVVDAMRISASFLPMLGLQPVAGRFFTSDEDETTTDAVLIGSEAATRRFRLGRRRLAAAHHRRFGDADDRRRRPHGFRLGARGTRGALPAVR